MQRFLMSFSTRHMNTKHADCIVIGSGAAGLYAAWNAARTGRKVLLAVRDGIEDSNTSKAQGGIAAVCRTYGIDLREQPIPIASAVHYMIGGVWTDAWGRTSISGLYAAGEAACTGLHGANRLASNSLLEGLVFGRRAAMASAREPELPRGKVPVWEVGHPKGRGFQDLAHEAEMLHWQMAEKLGICRTRQAMEKMISYIEAKQEIVAGSTAACRAGLDFRNQLTAAELIARAALRRQESRGAHFRTDYPERRKEWQHSLRDQAVWPASYGQGGGTDVYGSAFRPAAHCMV